MFYFAGIISENGAVVKFHEKQNIIHPSSNENNKQIYIYFWKKKKAKKKKSNLHL